MENNAIICKELCCQSGHRFLLKNINWKVKKGEHWVVFGLNGSGKTTLLSLIAGFKTQTSGLIKIFGEEYGEDNVIELRKKVGWVSSSFFDRYFTKESVMHIILSGLCGTFCPDNHIKDQDIVLAKDLLRSFNLGDKMNRPYNTLSKGEQQSVLIVRALIGRPEIIVLDEPGTGLDIQARDRMLQFVKQIAQETKATIIYVTHYPEEILEVFNHCMLLRHGRIYNMGATKEMMSPEVLTDYLGKNTKVDYFNGKLQVSMDNEIAFPTTFLEARW